jgi:HEPN domain-containing protein
MPIARQHAEASINWLSWADKDYVAARRLLLDGLLVQGACLANTAIEKYLKATLNAHGKRIPHTHDPSRLYQEAKSFSTLKLDEAFLMLLVNAYRLRYPDDLKGGFNISLSQALMTLPSECVSLSRPVLGDFYLSPS